MHALLRCSARVFWTTLSAFLLAAAWAAPAAAEFDGCQDSGSEPMTRADRNATLNYLRDTGRNGSAMAEYMEKDRIPICYGRTPKGKSGYYLSKKKRIAGWTRDSSSIVLHDDLKSASPESVGETLYHEYVHRLQDKAGAFHGDCPTHSKKGFDKAMGYLESETGSGAIDETVKYRRTAFARGKSARLELKPGGGKPSTSALASYVRPRHTRLRGAVTARSARRSRRSSVRSSVGRRKLRPIRYGSFGSRTMSVSRGAPRRMLRSLGSRSGARGGSRFSSRIGAGSPSRVRSLRSVSGRSTRASSGYRSRRSARAPRKSPSRRRVFRAVH